MRSPTSRVGYIEVEGIDLGSAKDDQNRMLTLKAVKAALALSEQTFNSFDNQLLLESFKSSDIAFDEAAATAATVLFSTIGPCFPVLLDLSAVAAVPPLSTKLPAFPILGWLLGNHLDPCKKGMMEASLTGEIPKTPVKEETIDDEEDEEEDGVGEKIQYYFQVHRRFPSQFRGHSCLCVILSAQGAISGPRMNMRGAQVIFEGLYEIVRLSGFFFVSNNGQVQLSDSLKLTFRDPDGGVFGGPVIGSLIAATPLQVAVLTFIHDA
ncbi:uncharacterized protein [Coffea arabica]|uniref:AT-hook motif nuclear-localized protein n=1 Tax=Coffea arabica TaxID=13443 RepID=A0ABM4U1U8_COFAR